MCFALNKNERLTIESLSEEVRLKIKIFGSTELFGRRTYPSRALVKMDVCCTNGRVEAVS